MCRKTVPKDATMYRHNCGFCYLRDTVMPAFIAAFDLRGERKTIKGSIVVFAPGGRRQDHSSDQTLFWEKSQGHHGKSCIVLEMQCK